MNYLTALADFESIKKTMHVNVHRINDFNHYLLFVFNEICK